MTVSVRPWPMSARELAKRAVRITPARAAIVPLRTNRSSFPRATRTPENRAALAFLPSANSWRPGHMAWRTTPSTIASPTKMSSGHGIGVPGTVPNPNDVNQSGNPLTPSEPRTTSARPR